MILIIEIMQATYSEVNSGQQESSVNVTIMVELRILVVAVETLA